MIVLSRKKNESIMIGDDIVVVVVEIRGDKVRLGFEYPQEVAIHRREVYDAIRRNEAAAGAPPPSPQPATVRLSGRHVALLDRLSAQIGGGDVAAPRREEVVAAILDRVEAMGERLNNVRTLEDLRAPEPGRGT